MTSSSSSPQRIAKFLSHAGVCSRREAERLIEEGKVSLNGQVLQTPAQTITPQDHIEVEGKRITLKEKTCLWCYHKPVGLLCTHYDPQGRPTIFQSLTSLNLSHVISVGRLDLNSEGLLLLTNIGELARFLELPSHNHQRTYRVRVKGLVQEQHLIQLRQGITVEGIHYKPVDVTIDRFQSSNTWLYMTLSEGKNREIRRLMEHFGYQVNRLIRTCYGPFSLGTLKPGEVKEVPESALRDFFKGKGLRF